MIKGILAKEANILLRWKPIIMILKESSGLECMKQPYLNSTLFAFPMLLYQCVKTLSPDVVLVLLMIKHLDSLILNFTTS